MAQHHFKTEVSRLLDLIIHSLYSHKEIFLRELVSNASDALDKLRYLSVSDEAYKAVPFEPSIRIVLDRGTMTLAVEDSGVGMDEKELEENLGTIARSGTRRFLEKLPEGARKETNLIGQFGVGFYSAFMVADKVEVTSMKAGTGTAFRWTSDGKGEYAVEPAEKTGQGTEVRLHLNAEGQEYLSRWQAESILKKYSNHIAYPITLVSEEKEYDDKGKEKGTKRQEEVINDAQALWRRPKSELKDADYIAFYKSFAASMGGGDEEPLHWLHTKAEGTIEYATLFFIPSKAPFDLYRADYKAGVKLYVKRVFITDDEKELLPVYLRFVRGIIDSEDLPLNISREILQQNKVMANIRQASVKKILGELSDMAKANPDKYAKFITEFNRPLKEGLYSDFASRETLLGLVRWKSTRETARETAHDDGGAGGWTGFADYKSRMKEGQKAIYYISGGEEERLRKSPLLEMYRKEGIEVLVCGEEIDEIVLSGLGPYEGLELKSVNRAGSESELGGGAEEAAKKSEDGPAGAVAVEKAKKALGAAVKDVRLSRRLDESPACVVVDSDDPSLQFRELMKQLGGGELPDVKPILELNASHALVKRLAAADEAEAEDLAKVLLGQALLVEGAPLADPSDFAARLTRLLK
jgi:molecular chaperone HtpG